jgi:hypothetical protein
VVEVLDQAQSRHRLLMSSSRAASPHCPSFHTVRSIAIILFALALAGCAEPPSFNVGAARDAAGRAIRAVRAESPDQARSLESLVAAAERATARDRGFHWGAPRAPAAWQRVLRESRRQILAIRQHQEREREAWQLVEAELSRSIERAEGEVGEAGMGIREAMAYRRARVASEMAQRFARDGAWDRAAGKVEEAQVDLALVHEHWLDLHQRFGDPGLQRRWQDWVEDTISESRKRGRRALVADKRQRRLDVYEHGRLVASFTMDLGANGLSPKQHSGDRATPEGRYKVVQIKNTGQTKYYKALLIDYPNGEDLQRYWGLRREGAIPRGVGPGNLIEIHGEGGRGKDWTDGCIALSNPDMDKLFRMVEVDMPVTIVGSYRRGAQAR